MKKHIKADKHGIPYARCLEYEKTLELSKVQEEDTELRVVNQVKRIKILV
jgi:hypothetical protein